MNYVFYKERDGKVVATEIVPEEDIKRVAVAGQDVMRVYRVEEIFHMIMSALLEFNSVVFQRADLGRVADDNVVEAEMFRIHINQCAAMFLTALDMYHEYLQPENGPRPFAISGDRFNDSRFAICKAVRNYIQHVSTVGINISWGWSACACEEQLCSCSVSADAIDMRRHMDKLHKASLALLNKFLEGKEELNLYEIFNGVVDLLSEIHNAVRASKEYAVDYENSALFLAQLHERLDKQGFFWYHYEDDGENKHRGRVPYLYERQREMISFLRQRYKCRQVGNKYYATTAPHEMIHRMAEADQIVEQYVKDNGVLAELDNGSRKITSSKFTTKKMRDWYLQKSHEAYG